MVSSFFSSMVFNFILLQTRWKSDLPFCITPVSKGSNNNTTCLKHARIVSELFRSLKLDHHQFILSQRYKLKEACGVRTVIELMPVEHDGHGSNCVMRVSTPQPQGGQFPYVVSSACHSAQEIHEILNLAFRGNTKIFLRT